ncbi:hypothetical protein AALO_G00180910 [Alosa alosa]|uniref:Uncharacterized protein n=1 Tax=Alosa alosa TaxID=278164 RepID=A0AAV6GBT1_9TELE|nr:hypothetical protein AALO_G00180910 [Alosa alosa]
MRGPRGATGAQTAAGTGQYPPPRCQLQAAAPRHGAGHLRPAAGPERRSPLPEDRWRHTAPPPATAGQRTPAASTECWTEARGSRSPRGVAAALQTERSTRRFLRCWWPIPQRLGGSLRWAGRVELATARRAARAQAVPEGVNQAQGFPHTAAHQCPGCPHLQRELSFHPAPLPDQRGSHQLQHHGQRFQ